MATMVNKLAQTDGIERGVLGACQAATVALWRSGLLMNAG